MSLPKKSILIADHSKTFTSLLSVLLERMGFDVVTVGDGIAALKAVNEFEPNLIMLEVTIPKMDGVKALTHMKSDKHIANIPVVMLSIDAEEDMIRQCKKIGSSGFIKKPIKLESLHNILQDCIYSPVGIKRKHVRTTFISKVSMTCNKETKELYSENLSSGGIYVRSDETFPPGSDVNISFPLLNDESISLNGRIVYVKGFDSKVMTSPPGMAIEFMDISDENSSRLEDFVSQLLTCDIIDIQKEPVITLD
jgi:CheY-like chemotaxis protein